MLKSLACDSHHMVTSQKVSGVTVGYFAQVKASNDVRIDEKTVMNEVDGCWFEVEK